MCMITYLEPNVMPDVNALLNGSTWNDDGHGFAIVRNNELIIRHSLDAVDLINEFVEERSRYPEGPAMFHSRMATHGTTSLKNCHPFQVGNDPRTVIAHNGVLPAPARPKENDWRSDTKYACDVIIPKKFGSLRSGKVRRRIQNWMGSSNKFVILTVDRSFSGQAFILNEAHGYWEEGAWYSNTNYLNKYSCDPKYYGGWGWESECDYYVAGDKKSDSSDDAWMSIYEDKPVKCNVCNTVIDLDNDEWCPICNSCTSCDMEPGDCICYRPPITDEKEPWWATEADNVDKREEIEQ